MRKTYGPLAKGMVIFTTMVWALLGFWAILGGGAWDQAMDMGLKLTAVLGVATVTVLVINYIQSK